MKRNRELWASLLIGLFCMLVYNANRRAISAGDVYPARYLPFSIWRNHSVLLDPVVRLTAQGRGGTAFWMVPVPGGHTISLYPVVQPVLLAPLYLPAVGYLNLSGWTDARLDHVARVMEKLCASFMAALSAALLYLLLRRRASGQIALLLTFAYAFGTTTWVISSQALWQHGLAEFLVVGTLLLLTAPCTLRRALAVGLLCGLIAGNRPPDALLAAALGAYGLFWAGRRAGLLAAAAALPVGLVLLYNLGVAKNFAGAYGRMGSSAFFRHDLVAGLGGLLFSPTRGLFVFSPFLLFLVLAWRLPTEDRGFALALRIAVVLQLLLYAKTDWRSGIYWGSRYLTDLLPILLWMLVPVVVSLRAVGRICFLLAVGVAVAIESIGAFWYVSATDGSFSSGLISSPWDWRNAPFVASLRHGPAPAELLVEMRGQLDSIEAGGRATSSITAGQEIEAVGWALAGHATPRQVAVSFDGRQYGASHAFYDRPDLRAALREPSPAGWRIPLGTSGLASGEHHLTAFAWASDSGEQYYLGERTLTVRPAPAAGEIAPPAPSGRSAGRREEGNAAPAEGEDLDSLSKTAAVRVRERQQEPGYWLTSYTKATRYEDPHPEMNTYLTALLVELIDPLAVASGLGDGLERARRHLTRQIEAGGLVRYHGLPDGPGIGTLGCAITPDSDDTALVWRVAPDPDRRRLPVALATLARYRTPEGFYRTWLAPREAYQCLDPGSDPNPTDIAIQMHLLLLLSEVQPPAGRALCKALRPVVDQDRIWVYYSSAPLVPILRLPDLERAGCKLDLPESRMRTSVPGQEIWVSVVRGLGRARTRLPPADAARIESILRQLAQDDFALLRKSPPLLYHNDLTATVPRYYWSEDVGYALWLRLYDQYTHARRPQLN
ncbi:MAG TPA: hypothetical protein VGS22_24775 [Thermoanaerobaculia bacterium]|jgi:hypothetical protein|nr:hypothetical protein [Thermoanaerobaculia bacterium]